MRRTATALLFALALPATQSFAQAASDGVAPPSEAEQLLFMHPQLGSIHEARSIVYDYMALPAGGAAVNDHAVLALKPLADGRCCGTHVDFLSGDSSIALPDLDEPQGNPILMYFLENEVRTLEHATKGQAAHFRRRIRQTLADDAKVSAVTVRWNGQDVAARSVHITPYVTDPYRPRFERESATEYDFVLSDAIPGGVYKLSSTLPGAKPGDPPLVAHTLTIADPQPAKR